MIRPPLLAAANATRIRKEMLDACAKIASRHSLLVEETGVNDSGLPFYAEFALRISMPDDKGGAFDPNEEQFAVLAPHFGLEPSDYGRTFAMGAETFRITGLEPRRHRYPISAERLPDRKKLKFTAENVRAALAAQPAPTPVRRK